MTPEDVQHLVDIGAEIDDRHLSQVRFGRSRFLRTAGLALFGFATGLVAAPPEEAEAASVPRGCHGQTGCNCCNGCTCCENGCSKPTRVTCRASGGTCWRTVVNGKIYKCCDWHRAGGGTCICRCFVGTV
jgi:hypothetical protein